MMQFSTLSLAAPFLRALHEEGYHTPTPIQEQAIPPALEGRDLLGCAQTGTGKTAAFALPILHTLHTQPADKTRRGPAAPRALILAPTRELANQIADSFETYGRHTPLSIGAVYGGVSQRMQVRGLQRGVDILVATPGRLMDLMEQRLVNLSEVRVFVLDEADRMLDMGFIEPIRRISAALPEARQTMLFSATMPKQITRLAEALLRDPVRVAVTPVASAAPLIEQTVYMVSTHSKQALLEHTLEAGRIGRALVFTRTKHGADRVTKRLLRAGITATAIHGNKAQNQRQRALDGFRDGRSRVLVATDVAARGLDVDSITHVFNFDIPHEPEAYVHRIGRTGRAGAKGVAISFCDHAERGFLRGIERLTGKTIAPAAMPSLPKETRESREEFHDAARDERPERQPQSRRAEGPRAQGAGMHQGAHPGARSGAHPAAHPAAHHPGSGHGATRHDQPRSRHGERPAPKSGPGHAHAGHAHGARSAHPRAAKPGSSRMTMNARQGGGVRKVGGAPSGAPSGPRPGAGSGR